MSQKKKKIDDSDEYQHYYDNIEQVKLKLKELDQRNGKSRRSVKPRRGEVQADKVDGKRKKKSDRRSDDRRQQFDPETAPPDALVKHLIQLERRINERKIADRKKQGRVKKQLRQK